MLAAPAGSRGFELSWDGNRRLLVTYPASITLLRGSTPDLSQKLMRWRIGLQFIAILVIMLFVYLTRGFA